MDGIGAGLLVLIVLVLGGTHIWWYFTRSRNMVEQWARDNGLDLIAARRQVLFYGPFCWQIGRRAVFRVTVRDASGQVRHGYVRVGGFFLGLLSDQVNVEWD